MDQWLKIHTSNARDVVLIPGQGTKIPYETGRSQRTKKKMTSGCWALAEVSHLQVSAGHRQVRPMEVGTD